MEDPPQNTESKPDDGMERLFRMKGSRKSRRGAQAKQKVLMGELRLQKDLDDLRIPNFCKLTIPDKKKMLNLVLTISPKDHLFKGGKYEFTITIPATYPHKAPKVTCTQKIYHPNINLDGAVCLNILREDWKPVQNLSSVILGMVFLFEAPNPDDPLNKEAATVMKENPVQFKNNLRRSMAGGSFGGVKYDNVMAK